jgi:hypothetical protein
MSRQKRGRTLNPKPHGKKLGLGEKRKISANLSNILSSLTLVDILQKTTESPESDSLLRLSLTGVYIQYSMKLLYCPLPGSAGRPSQFLFL